MAAEKPSLDTIFCAAIEMPSPADRAAYLAEACAGDAELQARVGRLVNAHFGAGSFLEGASPELIATVDQPAAVERPGAVIGPYKLLEQIGEGGFGIVYLAEQLEPVRRKVALKVLKPGMDTRQVVARFEAERQALAIMDHPNIAKVFDGGATPSGRPYFVMELVKGTPITEFCDQNHLTPRQRLELFLSVCSAVQHAHQKGIIHRDLKPSNVLVSRHDSTPVVKVIDFGVAKAVGQSLTDKTLFTGVAQMVGTPLYMSPEQAGMSDLDVDTRSDIYSLGVLLYELLTGTTPFTKERFKQAAYDEIRRIIREEDPPRPSTRLSELGAPPTPRAESSLASISAQRHTEPAKLTKLVRGELDWIVMKALEKERGRRYETANGFALDVQRYLAGEPVLAVPASQWYWLSKFVRRNRRSVAAAVIVFITLIGGITGTTLGLLQAERHAKQAREERDAKDSALKAEQEARTNETKARQQAFDALRSMSAEVIEKKFTQGAALTEDDRAFLRSVIAQYDAFAVVKGDDTDSRAVRAEGRWRVGMMRYRLGEFKEAEQDYGQALDLYKSLEDNFPDRPEFTLGVASNHNNLGNLFRATGRPAEAEAAFTNALTIQKELTTKFPDWQDVQRRLATTYNNLGILLNDTNRPTEAERAYKDALTVQRQLAARTPRRPESELDLARSLGNLGNVFKTTYRFKEAESAYREAGGIFKQLVADFPRQIEFRYDLAIAYDNLGSLIQLTLRRERLKDAEAAHVDALAIFKLLAAEYPTRPEFRQSLALSYNNLAGVLMTSGRPRESEKAYLDAVPIYRHLVVELSGQPDVHNGLASSLTNLAMMRNQDRDFKSAKAYLEEAHPHYQAALKDNPRNPLYRQFYRNSLRILIATNAGLHDQPAAAKEARTLGDLGWDPSGDAHYAAHALALCIPIVGQEQELDAAQRKAAVSFYGDEAMKFLREAVERGWRDAAMYLTRDPALAPLRQRDDFKKLLAEVQAAPKQSANIPGMPHTGKP
jgi:serine/threonine protein kinase